MEQDMINAQKEALLSLQKELSERLEKLQADLMKPHSADSSEQAVERENDEVVEQLAHETEEELIQVGHSLVRIENGSYGVCEACGEDIAPARLQSLPYVTKCVRCA